ncbi:hypothetical protein BY996DRAFT_4571691, partial [Phakopsora pachyrhizi]
NGVVRQDSIHSNHQSPSHDIVNNFQNYSALRYCLSGGNIQDETSSSAYIQSSQVKNLLLNNPSIQILLGLDPQTLRQKPKYPFFKKTPQCSALKDINIPSEIKVIRPNSYWIKISTFELDEHQSIESCSFI